MPLGSRSVASSNQSPQKKDSDEVRAAPADGPNDFGYTIPDARFIAQKPTLAYARTMPTHFSAMRHEQILQLCMEGSFGARKEALTRNVMSVDNVEYAEASQTVAKMLEEDRKYMAIHYFPYHAGFFGSVAIGIASFPLVFHLPSVQWFNEAYVTTDTPDLKDLQTYLEVGSWSWGWMEPILGQASFALLIAQFARSQMLNLGIKPFGNFMKSHRADTLEKRYPQYEALFVRWCSESASVYGSD